MATTKKWTTRVGRVPGPGKWQQDLTSRPEDRSLVSRTELKDLVGVSNVRVISAALDELAIAPCAKGSKVRRTYNNGGRGDRNFDVPYYDAAVVPAIHRELLDASTDLGSGNLKYRGCTFRWVRGA